MQITNQELCAAEFKPAGVVVPDPSTPLRCVNPGSNRERWEGLYRVDASDVLGLAIYMMVVNSEVKKVGLTGTGSATFKTRMESEFGCLRQFIAQIRAGRLRYIDDCLYYRGLPGESPKWFDEDFPWKHRVPSAMIQGVTVHLWVQKHDDPQVMSCAEKTLNRYFRGDWASEGWAKRDGARVRAAVPSDEQVVAAREVMDRGRKDV